MLRHFLASAARTTSRSLLAAHFNRSSACVPSSRSLFTQHNKRALVPIRRAFASQTEAPNKTKPPKITWSELWSWWPVAIGYSCAIAAILYGFYKSDQSRPNELRRKPKESKHLCVAEYDPMPKISENAQSDQSIKKPDLLESAKVSFVIGKPEYGQNKQGFRIGSGFEFSLPKATTCNQICDELASRGIHVDLSQEGFRRGLTAYALKYMQKGVEEHAQKKCRCDDQKKGPCPAPKRSEPFLRQYDFKPNALESEIPPKKHDVFENGRVWFSVNPIRILPDRNGTMRVLLTAFVKFDLTDACFEYDYEKIYDGLKQRGIHVDRSKEGVRCGLTEYALKYMQKGMNEHKLQLNCNSVPNSALSSSSAPI